MPFVDFSSLQYVLVLASHKPRSADAVIVPAAKAAVLFFFVTIVQVTIVSEIGILGGSPDLVLVTLVAVALTQGSIFGAVTGFWAGLLLDIARLGTLGFTSLLLTLAGFWIGRYGETTGRDRAHAPLLSVAVVTVLYAVGSLVMHFLLREPAPAQVVLVEELPGTIALNLLLTLPGLRARPTPVRRAGAAARRSSSLASRPTPIRPGRFLPRDPRVDAPYRLTPQLVFRIGILGFLTLAAFAILFFRLWALQVLSGNQYLVAAQNNQLRVHTHRRAARADRGPLRPGARRQHERDGGQDLARRPAQARRLRRAAPPRADPRGPARGRHERRSRRTAATRSRRSPSATPSTRTRSTTCYEHQSEFPGMTITNTFVRNYPFGDLAAHILGYVGEISQGPAEVEQGLRARRQDRPGRDRVLVRQGAARAAGPEPAARRLARAADQPDRAAHADHARLRGPAHARREAPARRAAGDRQRDQPRSGRPPVVREGRRDRRPRPAATERSARSPRTRPSTRTCARAARRAPSRRCSNPDVAKADDYPALDRAIAGAYPPGSTFKPVTALAAMQEHILSPYNALPVHAARTRSRARSSRTGTRS